TGQTVHTPDVLRYYKERGASAARLEQVAANQRRFGVRTVLSVPLLRGGTAVGVLALIRQGGEPRPFSAREIALAESFADQAGIAIGNPRMFEEIQTKNRELTETLEQQTATADVLRIISRSGFDLQAVLDAVVERAARLAASDDANIFLLTEDQFLGVSHW